MGAGDVGEDEEGAARVCVHVYARDDDEGIECGLAAFVQGRSAFGEFCGQVGPKKFLQEVFPRDPGVQDEQDALEHQPVRMPLPTRMTSPTLQPRQERLDHRPEASREAV